MDLPLNGKRALVPPNRLHERGNRSQFYNCESAKSPTHALRPEGSAVQRPFQTLAALRGCHFFVGRTALSALRSRKTTNSSVNRCWRGTVREDRGHRLRLSTEPNY